MNHSVVVLRNLVDEIVEHLRDLISLMFRKWGNFFQNSEIETKSKKKTQSILRYLSGDYSKVVVGDKESKKNWPMFKDIGGLYGIRDDLISEILVPLCHPEMMPQLLGVKPISGILLHGPPGCGKPCLLMLLLMKPEFHFIKWFMVRTYGLSSQKHMQLLPLLYSSMRLMLSENKW